MVFKKKKAVWEELIIEIFTSLIVLIRYFFYLIFFPYQTVRKISLEKDYYQSLIIFLLIFSYFKFAYFLKNKPYPATLTFSVFLFHFFLTLIFFFCLGNLITRKRKKEISFLSLLVTFSYSLLPTLIWFGSVSLLYLFLPPPRSPSFLGVSFSVFFIAFSLSLLIWKMILVFLSLRFSLRLNFYQIIYLWLLYFLWFIPYSFGLYYLRIFKIPFI